MGLKNINISIKLCEKCIPLDELNFIHLCAKYIPLNAIYVKLVKIFSHYISKAWKDSWAGVDLKIIISFCLVFENF